MALDEKSATGPVIRITREEASSQHVDDLLRRQMSMRGEQGITADRGRRWYYQNWFVFMMAGALGAFIAWGALEPFFDDLTYIQGTIDSIDASATGPDTIDLGGGRSFEFDVARRGRLEINGQTVWLAEGARPMNADTREKSLFDGLTVGKEVGIYVHFFALGEKNDIALGAIVDLNPPVSLRTKGHRDLATASMLSQIAAIILFPFAAGLVGLAIGAADGLVCRLFRRALLAGGVGLLVGVVGGFVTSILASLLYAPINAFAVSQMTDGIDPASMSPLAFVLQMLGRGLAWTLAGMAMGLGQGIALRSKRLAIYGFLGGVVGGLLGGLLFDPIDILILGGDKPSAHISRMVGFTIIGAVVGAMIGVVELLARDAWLRMTQGPLAGKEFLIFKDTMHIGASPRSDIYLFNDDQVAENHAMITLIGDACEIASAQPDAAVLLNGRPIKRSRMRNGDTITLGKTSFVFQTRR